MKNRILIFSLFYMIIGTKAYGQDSIPITISTSIFAGNTDEWIHLKITDTTFHQIWYDSLATVTIASGFDDTIYLDSGTYKCEIINMGANVSMPILTLNNGYVVPWGNPNYEYYLFSVPGGELNSFSTIAVSACNSYKSPSSKYTWTSSGTYFDTIPNTIGWDSIITINLTIISINSSISISNGALSANEPDANYQWLACNSGIDIYGAINQVYTPIVSGLYAVRITKNGCFATSLCYTLIVTNLNDNIFEASLSFYPNPVNDYLSIDLGKMYYDIGVEVNDLSGKNILKKNFKNQRLIQLNFTDYKNGVYIISFKSNNKEKSIKIIKN